MDTVLQLGPVVFSNLEIPESLALGGGQRLARHNFPGGARNVQALGSDHAPISWSGLMLGAEALDRARAVDYLRSQGRSLELSVFDLVYTVVIERFEYSIERFYKVPYRITCEVVSLDSDPVKTVPESSFDSAIQADSDSLLGLSIGVGDGILSGAVGTLSATIRQVGRFSAASTATIGGVTAVVASVRGRIDALTMAADATLGSVSVVGGVLPNTPLAQITASMAGQVQASAAVPAAAEHGQHHGSNRAQRHGREPAELHPLGAGGRRHALRRRRARVR